MSSTAFAKNTNAEIFVRDLSVQNPLPEYLQMRLSGDGQVFYARTGVILQCIYSDLDSLSAFSKDELISVYAVHMRDNPAATNRFVLHNTSSSTESLELKTFSSLDGEIRSYVPADLAR